LVYRSHTNMLVRCPSGKNVSQNDLRDNVKNIRIFFKFFFSPHHIGFFFQKIFSPKTFDQKMLSQNVPPELISQNGTPEIV
jgi:hypothetical protein